jgi:hypothetical protein
MRLLMQIAFPILRHKKTGFELLENACFEGVQGDAALYARAAILLKRQRRSPSDRRIALLMGGACIEMDSSIIDTYISPALVSESSYS